MSTPLKQGRVCPKCKAAAEPDDLFCPACAYEFQATDPVVLLNPDGTVHDPDGSEPAAGGDSQPRLVPHFDADTTGATSTAADTAVVAPVITPPADTAAVAPAKAPDDTPPAKICYIDVAIDTTPRPGRPDDVDPPTEVSGGCTLTAERMAFGRASLQIPISGDLAVSRLHGYFVRRPDGGYKLSSNTENFTEVSGKELNKGEEVDLKDGDQIKVGDFYLITYHED